MMFYYGRIVEICQYLNDNQAIFLARRFFGDMRLGGERVDLTVLPCKGYLSECGKVALLWDRDFPQEACSNVCTVT